MASAEYPSPLGVLTLTGEGGILTGVFFSAACPQGEAAVFSCARTWLDAYFAGKDPGPPPPLAPQGTGFQKAVWQAVTAIPRGSAATYGEIAQALHSSPRAVGRAVGSNPIPIFIPCHRVLGAHGSLTGYRGGLERKSFLLSLEGFPL